MIHNVISEVDMGKPILVREIPFVKGVDEDLDKFEQKVHEIEWGTVIEGIQIVINDMKGEKQWDKPVLGLKHEGWKSVMHVWPGNIMLMIYDWISIIHYYA